MFTRMPNTCIGPVCVLITLVVLAKSADGQLTKRDPYYSLTQNYFNLQNQPLAGTFTQSNASVLGFVVEDDETENSIGLSALGDWTYRVPRQAGFGKVTSSAFLPFSVGNHPVEGFSFTRVLESRWVNGGGSDTDHLAMTVGSSNLYVYELFPSENPDNPAPTIGPQVLAVVDPDPVSLVAGNGSETVDDTIRRVDSYIFAANTDYLMEMRVTTDIVNHSFLADYPTRLVTSEFGGNISRGSGYRYSGSFLWRPLPEPGTWILGMSAVLCGAAVGRRKPKVVAESAPRLGSGLAGIHLSPSSDCRRRNRTAYARLAGTLLLAIVAAFYLTGRLHAATFGTGQVFVGRWDDPNNWKDSIIPDANQDATILGNATAQVIGGVAYARNLKIAHYANVDISTSGLYGPGQLYCTNVNGPDLLGYGGDLRLDGDGSFVAVSDKALVNKLSIQRGGVFSGGDTTIGEGIVDSPNSYLTSEHLTVVNGHLKIQNRGAVDTNSLIGDGVVTVNGVGASLATNTLQVAGVVSVGNRHVV